MPQRKPKLASKTLLDRVTKLEQRLESMEEEHGALRDRVEEVAMQVDLSDPGDE